VAVEKDFHGITRRNEPPKEVVGEAGGNSEVAQVLHQEKPPKRR
jgi:hypothetical protein